jgi:16S rRNA (guanine527-N7)-methyltransferase
MCSRRRPRTGHEEGRFRRISFAWAIIGADTESTTFRRGTPAVTDAAATPRHDLPTDPALLQPMGEAFDSALESGLAELGLLETAAASATARRTYEAHARLLRDWNTAINLTAIRDPEMTARRHVCDSLSAAPHLAGIVEPGMRLLDIGSGGGYPGLPLAAALPFGRVDLLDSVRKKARFLGVAGAAVASILEQDGDGVVSTPVIESIAERAEDVAEEPDGREAWDVVTCRAVGSLAEVLELSLPLTREGGTIVAWKREEEGSGLSAELQRAGSIIRAAGGGRPRVFSVEATALQDHRLVIVTKERPTPAVYPRPTHVRRKRKR